MNTISANSLSTAGSDEVYHNDTKESPLNSHYESIYRSVVAKANYLAADRPDIQFAKKRACPKHEQP